MIITGEIFAIDCGDQEIIFHVATDDGPVACHANTEHYESAIRLCFKYKYRIKLAGEYLTLATYRSPKEVLFKIWYFEQILVPEVFEFILTGAL